MISVVRWGLIGAGDIARKRIAPALRDLPTCELISVSRAKAELAEAFAKEFGARSWFADWREMMADSDVDAIYIATPVFLHAEQTVAAAEAGKHVLCEKPMALNVNECDKMIAACRSNNVKLGVAYYRRFYPAIARIKEIIASGKIGSVSVAHVNAFEYFNPGPDHPRHWFIEKSKSGGGPMMDFGCHRIELLINLFGRVKALHSILSDDLFDREVEDTASAIFHFEKGTTATLTVTHAAAEARDTVDIYGTIGSIHVQVLNDGEIMIDAGGEVRKEHHPPARNIHAPLIADFAEAILQDRDPEVTGDDGRDVQSIIADVYATVGSYDTA